LWFQFDATTWGWIHLLVGLLVASPAGGCCQADLGPSVRAHLAVISAITNSCSSPTPFWALLLITLDVFVNLGGRRPWRRPAGTGLTANQ
jgi:hypothetical protein